jgi:hypothetical protein
MRLEIGTWSGGCQAGKLGASWLRTSHQEKIALGVQLELWLTLMADEEPAFARN